ncbi:MAG TPA: hypothetical protein VHZ76_00745 [Gammaproteobacteria bacterium]|jgi:hypothetical protein|nr:hypothetical protein [Gammaproteobacteria bacterium]
MNEDMRLWLSAVLGSTEMLKQQINILEESITTMIVSEQSDIGDINFKYRGCKIYMDHLETVITKVNHYVDEKR